MKGSEVMQMGIDDLIFTRDSHADNGYLYLKITDLFLKSWKCVTDGENYQTDFHTFVLKALIEHNKIVLKKDNWDSDRLSWIACLIDDLKSRLFEPQTNLMRFS